VLFIPFTFVTTLAVVNLLGVNPTQEAHVQQSDEVMERLRSIEEMLAGKRE